MRVFRNRKQGVPHRWELSRISCTVVSAVQMYRQYLSGLPNLPSNTGGVQRRVRFGKPDIPPAADIIGTRIRVQTNMKRGRKRLVEPGAAQHPEKRKEYFGSMCDKKQTEKNRFEECQRRSGTTPNRAA